MDERSYQPALLAGYVDQLGAGAGLGLGEEVAQVELYGALAGAEPPRDISVAQPLRHQAQHLHLPRSGFISSEAEFTPLPSISATTGWK